MPVMGRIGKRDLAGRRPFSPVVRKMTGSRVGNMEKRYTGPLIDAHPDLVQEFTFVRI
jgi:hypothetical protein